MVFDYRTKNWRKELVKAKRLLTAAGLSGGYIASRNSFSNSSSGVGRRRSRSAAGLSQSPYIGSRRRIMPGRRAKSRQRVRINIDGSSTRTALMKTKKRRQKKRKLSLKQEVAKMKKNQPKFSTKTFRDFKTICMSFSNPNEHRIFEIKCYDKNILEDYVKNLTLVDSSGVADYSTSNSSIKMSNFYKLMVKNNRTSNAQIAYAFYVCKDDDDESPCDSIREELIDRGYTGIPAVSGLFPATATASELPRRIVLGSTTPYHVPAFSGGALNRNWKIDGKVKIAKIGPGDTLDLVWSRSDYLYKQEEKDQENTFDHIKGMSVYLVISVYGDLTHDQVNTGLVGRGRCQLDCEEQRQTICRYANPKGLREIDYTDTLTNVNFTIPVHADNMASAMEIDDV